MTKATKKKLVVQELNSAPDCRILEDNEKLVRVICGRGNNLHEVEEIGGDGTKFLVSMPGKFRKTVWVRRGNCLLVTDIPEGDKVKAEIAEILTRKRINNLKKTGAWPEAEEVVTLSDGEDFINENRNAPADLTSSSSSDEC